jgi:hypothetical protein
MHPAKFSDQQAISKIDWLSTLIRDTSAYPACGYFKDPEIQTSLATTVIGKHINKSDSSYITATTHQNRSIYTGTHLSSFKPTRFINTHVHPDL